MSTPAVQWDILKQELRQTVRALTRAPGFALTVILVTALGVGANTAAFSVADFVLLRPLPFADPEALVRLCEGPRQGGGWGCMNQMSPANYRDLTGLSSSFAATGAFAGDAANLVGGAEPRRLTITAVSPEVLPLLGVEPMLGRIFDSRGDDDGRTAIISYGLWRSQFGGDRGVIGQTINLNGAPFTIVGVMPAAFYFPTRDTQLWRLLTLREPDFANRTNTYLEGIGRLKPGVTFGEARAELTTLAERLGRDYPDTNAETGVSFYRMRDAMSPRFRIMLLTLSGASLCLLLLSCASLANLMLARAGAQERELAVRAALGAGRARLLTQLITQSAVLTACGGVLGVLLAHLAIPLFSALVPPSMPLASQPALDLRVLAVAASFTVLTALGFGLVPALRVGRLGFAALRDSGRTSGGARQRLRSVLVTVEITISVVLLITSGLLIRAVLRVQAVGPGFVAEDVLTLKTALPRPKYDSPVRRHQFYEQVLTRVRTLPAVQSAAFTSGLPMILTGQITTIEIPGQEVRSARSGWGVSHRWITSQYFRTMGIPILHGRDVEASDTADRTWIAVVSTSFAERYWPGQDPIGKTLRHRGQTRTVVGVVGEVKVRGLERSNEPQMYLPAPQTADVSPPGFDPKDMVIRHSTDRDALITAVRQIVRAVDPEQPISEVRTLDDVLAGETASRRTQLQVLGALAAIAVLLSCVGIYGLLAYTVSQRSREIGVRLALGASPSRVGRMIFTDGLRLAMWGITAGTAGAYGSAQAIRAMLFGVAPTDPATFAAAIALVLVVVVAGSVVPVRRAVAVSPMAALKAE